MDWSNLSSYYQELAQDIYPQPPDDWHQEEMKKVIYNWIAPLRIGNVLDVGCGEGDAETFFTDLEIAYLGIALGADVPRAQELGRNVQAMDFNFLEFPDGFFGLIFARHVLEHSPFPILTLMEWHRVSNKYLCLVVPNPQHFTFTGRNHYSVAYPKQTTWWLRRAGWKPEKLEFTPREFKFLCVKEKRIGYEGYASVPLARELYEFERDSLIFNKEMDVSIGKV